MQPILLGLLLVSLGLGPIPLQLNAQEAAPARHTALLGLVPEGAQFCLMLQGLRERFRAVKSSPFAAAWCKTPFAQRLLDAPELRDLAKANAALEAQLGIGLAEIRDELLGDVAIFAYLGEAANRSADARDRGVVLLWVREPVRLQSWLNRLNRLPDVASVERETFQEIDYQIRRRHDGHADYYCLHQHLVIYATDQTSMRQVIRRLVTAPQPTPLAQHLEQLDVLDKLLVFWIAPRSLDDELAETLANAQGEERAFLAAFVKHWKACIGLAVFLDVDRDFQLGLAVHADPHQLPKPTRAFLRSTAIPSALLPAIPSDALVAASGRLEVQPLLGLLEQFITPATRERIRQQSQYFLVSGLGPEQAQQLPRRFGPDWAAWLRPPQEGQPGFLPRAIYAVKFPVQDPARLVRRRVESMLQLGIFLAAMALNQTSGTTDFHLAEEQHNGHTIYSLDSSGRFPPGLEPAICFFQDYFLLASSPGAIKAFQAPDAVVAEPHTTIPLIQISLCTWHSYLEAHGPALAAWLAELNRQDPAKIEAELLAAANNLQVFKRLELLHRFGPMRWQLLLRLTPGSSLQPE